jgi:hypothetical protein
LPGVECLNGVAEVAALLVALGLLSNRQKMLWPM